MASDQNIQDEDVTIIPNIESLQQKNSANADHRTLDSQVQEGFNTIQDYDPKDTGTPSWSHNSTKRKRNVDPILKGSINNPSKDEVINERSDSVIEQVHSERDNTVLGQDEEAVLMRIPESVENKKMCRFCGKTFAHSGSLGRHLDLFKGKKDHPFSLIAKIRANVARRGNLEIVKARRREKAKIYNRRDYVKAKNRARRRIMSKVYRIKESTEMQFYKSVNSPELGKSPSFPRLFLFFIPSSLWPDGLPEEDQLKLLNEWLQRETFNSSRLDILVPHISVGELQIKAKKAFNEWMHYDQISKQCLWNKELKRAACDAIGRLSLFDFATREAYACLLADRKKQEIVCENGHRVEIEGIVKNDQSKLPSDNYTETSESHFSTYELAELAKAATARK